MSELQDKINQILSNPEALKQVQSLGEQLGLSQKQEPAPPQKKPESLLPDNIMSGDMLKTITRIAPLMSTLKSDDNTTRLLNSLRPFLSEDKQVKLDRAEKMLKLLKLMPLLKDSGIF